MGKDNVSCPCSIEATMKILDGKWKVYILWKLKDGVLRFGQLKKKIPGISQNTLTRQLRELEKSDVVLRKVYPEVPPRVEYSMTDFGKTLIPILDQMLKWGNNLVVEGGTAPN